MIGFGTGKGAQQPLPQEMAATMAMMMGGGKPSPRIDPGTLLPGMAGWLPGSGAPDLSSVNPAQRETFLHQTAYADANRAPAGPSKAENDAEAAKAAAQAQAAKEAANRATAQQQADTFDTREGGSHGGGEWGGWGDDSGWGRGDRDSFGGMGGWGGIY